MALVAGMFGAMAVATAQNIVWQGRAGTAVEYRASRDDLGSPMLYEGWSVPLVLGFSGQWGPHVHEARASLAHVGLNAGMLRTSLDKLDNHQASPTILGWSYGYGRSIWGDQHLALRPGGGQRVVAGLDTQGLVFFRNYRYSPDQIGHVEVWDAFLTLGAHARFERRRGPHHWQAGLSLPLVAYVMRPSYGVRGDGRLEMVDNPMHAVTSGQWATWPTFRQLEAHAGYTVSLGEYLRVGGDYRLQMYRYAHPMVTRGLSHAVGLTLGLAGSPWED